MPADLSSSGLTKVLTTALKHKLGPGTEVISVHSVFVDPAWPGAGLKAGCYDLEVLATKPPVGPLPMRWRAGFGSERTATPRLDHLVSARSPLPPDAALATPTVRGARLAAAPQTVQWRAAQPAAQPAPQPFQSQQPPQQPPQQPSQQQTHRPPQPPPQQPAQQLHQPHQPHQPPPQSQQQLGQQQPAAAADAAASAGSSTGTTAPMDAASGQIVGFKRLAAAPASESDSESLTGAASDGGGEVDVFRVDSAAAFVPGSARTWALVLAGNRVET